MKGRRSVLAPLRGSALTRHLAVAGAVAGLLNLSVARGADQTWGGSVFDGFWSNPQNWLGLDVPGSTSGTTSPDVATFNAPIANTWGNSGANPIGLDAGRNIQGINFTAAAGNYFIGATGGNALNLTSGGTIQVLSTLTATNAVLTVNAPLVIQGGAYTFANNSANGTGAGAGTLNFGGGITGGVSGASVLTLGGSNTNANTISGVIGNGSATLGLTKSGAGTWALSAANTYTGGTVVTGGTLKLPTGGSIGGAVTVGKDSGDNGALSITGGSVSSSTGTLGFSSGSTGTATVSSGSLTASSTLTIGNYGTGVLNVTGGSVSDYSGTIGQYPGSSGTATISGGTWAHDDTGGTLTVGNYGSGTLNVTGGEITDASGIIGYNSSGSGTATVSGGIWDSGNNLFVGYLGGGTLNVTGGYVFGYSTYVGFSANAQGTVTVSGGNLTTIFPYVGRSGTGTLSITDTGSVNVSGTATLALAQNSGSHGTLNFGTGGVAGTLSGVNTVAGGSGTAVVNFNHTGSYTFAPQMTGALKVNKLGAGTTVLTGASTYTGATTVTAGTLLVNGSIAGSATTVSNAGSTLGGTGTVGAVSVGNGAILEGGDGSGASGALTSGGTVSLLDGSTIELTLGASGAHSSLARTGGTWSFDNDQGFTFYLSPGATQPTTYQNIISGLSGSEAGLATIATWKIRNVGWSGTFSYDGAGGVDFTLFTAVPEPGTAAMALLMGGLAFLRLRGRRLRQD